MRFHQHPSTIQEVRQALDAVFSTSVDPGDGERWVSSGDSWRVLCYAEYDEDHEDEEGAYILMVEACLEYERAIQHVWPVLEASEAGIRHAVNMAFKMAGATRERDKWHAVLDSLPLDKQHKRT